MSDIDTYIVLLSVVGIALLFWKGKRRFSRLNQFGIEQYASYRHKVGTKIPDGLLYFIGFMLLGMAGITFFIEHAQSIPILSGAFVVFVIFLVFGTRGRSKM